MLEIYQMINRSIGVNQVYENKDKTIEAERSYTLDNIKID